MKKYSIRYISLFLLCLIFLSQAACHGSRKTVAFETPESFDETKEYDINFWAKNDTNKTQTEIYEKAIRDFEALYPNIHVTLRLYNDYSKIYNDVITNISTGTTPNVCITYPDHIATYLTGENTVVPLDELMLDGKYGLGGDEVRFASPTVEQINPQFLKEGRIGANQYALPFVRSTEALYINKNFVEALGYQVPDVLTWDFVWEVSEAAMKKGADGNYLINGQKVMIPFIYKSTDNMMIQLLEQMGADYTTASGQLLLFNEDTKSVLETVAEHTATGAFSTFEISSYPGNFLNAGQCIFAIDSTAGATWMGSTAPLLDISKDALVDFETVVRPIPQVDVNKPRMISQGPSVCVFNKADPQEVLASWLFTQYLLTNDVQIAYSQTEGYVPVTTLAYETADYQDYLNRSGEDNNRYYSVKIDAAKLLLAHTEDTFTTPVFNGSASVRKAAGQLIENTAKTVRRHESLDYDKIYSNVISLYRLDQISASQGAGADLGPLPQESRALLWSIAVAWLLIVLYTGIGSFLRRKKQG